MNTFKNYLIIDLEATCCKERIITREAMEIIEIGAVVVDAETLDVVDEYTTFIKPIILDSKLHNLDYPFNKEHLNIKKAFAKQQNIKPCGLDRALAHVGLVLEGTHHRGIDDARNMARLMPFIV